MNRALLVVVKITTGCGYPLIAFSRTIPQNTTHEIRASEKFCEIVDGFSSHTFLSHSCRRGLLRETD